MTDWKPCVPALILLSDAKNIKATLTLDYFKERFYREGIGRVKEPEPQPVQGIFFEYLQNFIEAKQNIFQPATIKTYVTLKKSLKDFEKAIGYKVEFVTLTTSSFFFIQNILLKILA